MIQDETKNIIKWENGMNRKINLSEIEKFLEKIINYSNDKRIDKFDFVLFKKKFSFYKKACKLVTEEFWQT